MEKSLARCQPTGSCVFNAGQGDRYSDVCRVSAERLRYSPTATTSQVSLASFLSFSIMYSSIEISFTSILS